MPQLISQALQQGHTTREQKSATDNHAHTSAAALKRVMIEEKREKPEINICVFSSASTQEPQYLNLARRVGEAIGTRGWGLVFGAGNVSMMGESAEGARDTGGYVTGVTIPLFFNNELDLNSRDPVMHEVVLEQNIYRRMMRMFEKSDALVVLPGGLGTVQETLAILYARQHDVRLQNKSVIFVNEDGFWDETIQAIENGHSSLRGEFSVVSNTQELETYFDQNISSHSSSTNHSASNGRSVSASH